MDLPQPACSLHLRCCFCCLELDLEAKVVVKIKVRARASYSVTVRVWISGGLNLNSRLGRFFRCPEPTTILWTLLTSLVRVRAEAS